MFPEYEQLRCDMLEVVTGAGVACSHYEVKDSTTNYWMKLCNRLWDANSGVFWGHVPHEGSKRICHIKKKVFNGAMLVFAKKHDNDVENQVESLPSFIMTRNTHDECLKMNKDCVSAKIEEKMQRS